MDDSQLGPPTMGDDEDEARRRLAYDRISIPALREYASGPPKIGTYTAVLPRHDLLALVEAVEADDARLAMLEKWAGEQADNPFADQVRQWAMSERAKLRARFDFGEET